MRSPKCLQCSNATVRSATPPVASLPAAKRTNATKTRSLTQQHGIRQNNLAVEDDPRKVVLE
eukprot:10100378-Alexandrium_andersonii.AAC.1